MIAALIGLVLLALVLFAIWLGSGTPDQTVGTGREPEHKLDAAPRKRSRFGGWGSSGGGW